MNKKRRVHYVLSTHWDREWYQHFQDYRVRLVELLDEVLEGISSGELRGPFQTDGQVILLDDYLEVRPERREQVESAARDGKMVIGPWYVMPDEFLVSGESLIRNLELGRRRAREFGGEPSSIGFICDMFGHISQMPQIFAGFGIGAGFLWRGVNLPDHRHFLWKGADGTSIPCYRFGRGGYCDYAIMVRGAGEYTGDLTTDAIRQRLLAFLKNESEASSTDSLLLFDGADHHKWDRHAYKVVADLMKEGLDAYEIVHTSLDDYQAQMVAQADQFKIERTGELREVGTELADRDWMLLIGGTLSSRVWIKQANAACESLLCDWAEPFSAFADVAVGRAYPHGFLDVAWKWLLENHPHDSICGCSIDDVHEGMKYRFMQSRQITHRQAEQAMTSLAASIEGELGERELRVVVFNCLPRDMDGPVELSLEIPTDWPVFTEFLGYESKPAFGIYDPSGQEVAYQRLAQTMDQPRFRIRGNRFPQDYKVNVVKVSLEASLPAMGYTSFTVKAVKEHHIAGLPEHESPAPPTRHAQVPGLARSERSMENENIAVTIEANGTLTLLDKKTGMVYSDLLTFEDAADVGDGWYHSPAVNDEVCVSSGCASDIRLVHDGPLLTTFRIRTTMPVPAEFSFDQMTRSPQIAHMMIDSRVSLRANGQAVEIETTVDNTADDHRLRVLFPSNANADTYLADSPFDVVERPIALSRDNHKHRELEVETRPQQSFAAVFDEHRGLAVAGAGLYESAVRDLPARSVALTLFRATRRTVFTDGEPGGQLKGKMTFQYLVTPLCGEPDRSQLFDHARLLLAGIKTVSLQDTDVRLHRSSDKCLPPSQGFLRLDSPAVLTSARQVRDGLELRLFNPTDGPISTRLTINHPATKAQPVDFEGCPAGEQLPIDSGAVTVELNPKQVATIRLQS